jgi:putative Mn2+ efflux pump MntP
MDHHTLAFTCLLIGFLALVLSPVSLIASPPLFGSLMALTQIITGILVTGLGFRLIMR